MASSIRRPMIERDRNESHRVSTPLELFFDLAVVVAIAAAASGLHHGLAEGHVVHSLLSFVGAFFAIWWAWVNFTWFSSAYDTDDVPMRFMTMLQMAGVLILAAGIPRVYAHDDYRVLVIGYVVMRIALVGQWIRAERETGDPHGICRRYWVGILVVQVLWIARLWMPEVIALPMLYALMLAEMAVPWIAERRTPGTAWHAEHIAERYSLVVIIVCGEVILSASNTFATAVEEGLTAQLLMVAVGAILIVFTIWWFYFTRESADDIRERGPWGWAYAHYFVFASVAATGAGIGVMVDLAKREAHLPLIGADLALAIAVATYLVVLGYVHHVVGRDRVGVMTAWTVAAIVLAVGVLGRSPGVTTLLIGLVMVAALLFVLWRDSTGADERGPLGLRRSRTRPI